MAHSFELQQIEVRYEASFFPPIMEIISYEKQLPFVKGLLASFNLKYGDLIVNPQALSHNFIFFRRYNPYPERGFFELNIGVDTFASYFFNPSSVKSAWEPSLRVLQSINGIVDKLLFDKQTLTFYAHCHSKQIKAGDIINHYNTLDSKHEYLKAKGVSFSFNGPLENSDLFLNFENSILIPDALFIIAQNIFKKEITEYKDIFEQTSEYLLKRILPSLDLDILVKG